ncbi:RNA exonuclease 4 [Contarinia nasturtii]|uniref:RNA exonuclease 4 n=1 Tax=Contarinia nasturtii TaxID=265458 RepID=UPI0012D471CD|nr:RNA exonuclease 4 [Contarinia nasturtii]
MSGKKETKINNKKILIGSVPIIQRSPSSKQLNKSTVTNANGLKDGHQTNKIDTHGPLATNKPSPAKTSRNQVSANWNSVAGSLKSQRTIPSAKKIGFLPKSSAIALDCEMVGIGPNGKDHMLARVSIVNERGEIIMDKYVKPTMPVIDYRTQYSGITPLHLEDAANFADVQAEVSRIKFNRILVGHALHNDLKVLKMEHPKRLIRDTSTYKKCREFSEGRSPSLRLLTNCILNYDIQTGAHCSVEDAQATMAIYKKFSRSWEKSMQKAMERYL